MQSSAPLFDVNTWRIVVSLLSFIAILMPPATVLYLQKYFVRKQDHTSLKQLDERYISIEAHKDYCASHKKELDGVGTRVNVADSSITRLDTRMDEAFDKLLKMEFHNAANKEHIGRVEGMLTSMIEETRSQNAQKATEYRELTGLITGMDKQLVRMEERMELTSVLDKRLGEMVDATRRER